MILLPDLPNIWENSDYYIVWKIQLGYAYSDSFIKFTINIRVSLVIIKIIYLHILVLLIHI